MRHIRAFMRGSLEQGLQKRLAHPTRDPRRRRDVGRGRDSGRRATSVVVRVLGVRVAGGALEQERHGESRDPFGVVGNHADSCKRSEYGFRGTLLFERREWYRRPLESTYSG